MQGVLICVTNALGQSCALDYYSKQVDIALSKAQGALPKAGFVQSVYGKLDDMMSLRHALHACAHDCIPCGDACFPGHYVQCMPWCHRGCVLPCRAPMLADPCRDGTVSCVMLRFNASFASLRCLQRQIAR